MNAAHRCQRARALCEVCRQRLDAAAWSIGKHPGCGPYQPLNDAAYDRLVAHLTQALGAITLTEKENRP